MPIPGSRWGWFPSPLFETCGAVRDLGGFPRSCAVHGHKQHSPCFGGMNMDEPETPTSQRETLQCLQGVVSARGDH